MRRPKKPTIGTKIVRVGMAHWASSVLTFSEEGDSNPSLYGYDLLRAVDLDPGHDIVLRVTVEVVSASRRCNHRTYRDGVRCTK